MLQSQYGIVSTLWMLAAFTPNTSEPQVANTVHQAVPQAQIEESSNLHWPMILEEMIQEEEPQMWEVAFQIKQATSSQLGATGNMRDTQPVFGSRGSHAAVNYHRSRGYAQAYHVPRPLVTSMDVARVATYRGIFGGRRRW